MAGGGQRQDFGNHVPAARKSSPNTEYPTPNVVDVIVIEDITKPANYRPILPGTTRANDSNLFLLGEREFERNTHEAWIRRAWTSRRHGEDSFNLALSYADKVSRAYPVFVRTYHILKSEYEALTEGTTLKSVVSIAVTSGGSGYTPDGQLALTIAGTGGGATAVCEVRDGVIVSAGMTNGGDGYTADPTATVTTPGGGAGATFTAKIQPQTAYLTEQEAEPAENIRLPHLDGQNATVNQAALFYKVIRVWRTIPGPSLASQKPDTDGMVLTTTKTLKLRSAITAGESMAALPTPADGNGIVSNGHVIFLSQTWVGVSGYLVPPIITITDTFGPGNGAAAHAVLTNGVITGVVLDAGGNSYVTATISITAPTSKLWTRTTMEVDAQSTLFAIEVVEMRQLPGAAVRSQRTEEDGIVVSVNRTLKELSTITTEESVAGGVWTKTSAEPVTALVGHQVTETRSLPGNPLPTDSWDNRRGAVQRTTQLVAAAAVDGTLTNNAGTITETSYQPVTSQVSRKIIETWVVALAPTLTSEKPDADGVLLSTARRLRLREDIHPAETVTSFGGDGSGAAATAQVTFDPATGAATVTAHGSGATLTDPTLDGDSGSGAAATATQSGGVVDPINIAAGGGGYHVPPRVIIEDTGGGTGTGATATCTISGGVVDTISITDGGSGYSMPSVLIVPGGYGGVHLSTFSISAAGSGYTAGGFITVYGDGTGATATPTFTGGALTGVTMTNPGSGYSFATAIVSGNRTITGGTVTHAGAGYTSPPAVTVSGDGTGATATATLTGGTVTGITITNAGTGYTSATLSIAAPTTGVIASITVTAVGGGYTTAPVVTISGGGSGAAATATLTAGVVTAIAVTAPGSGYPSATVTIEPVGLSGLKRISLDGDASAVVGTEVVETRALPGNVLTTYTRDAETLTDVQVDTQLIAKPSVPYSQSAGAEIQYHPISAVHGHKVTSTLLNFASVTHTRNGSMAYPFPTLVYGVSGALVEALDGTGIVKMNWLRRNGRSRKSNTVTTFTYVASATADDVFSPALNDLIYDGIFVSANERGVLNNLIDVTYTSGSGNSKWGLVAERMIFAASPLSASDYTALIGSMQIIDSAVSNWKYNLKRKANTTIKLL